jgi:seipin
MRNKLTLAGHHPKAFACSYVEAGASDLSKHYTATSSISSIIGASRSCLYFILSQFYSAYYHREDRLLTIWVRSRLSLDAISAIRQLQHSDVNNSAVYSDGPNPYSFVPLGSSIMAQQTYDIVLQLNLPRSPPNLQAGNFMLDIAMLSPTYGLTAGSRDEFNVRKPIPKDAIVFSSRRPAILTYQSDLVKLGKEVANLPWYILGWHRNAEKLEIAMAEGISFPKGWQKIPNIVYLEVQGRGQDIQVYDVQFTLRARFRGLKWLMYNHRIFSFLVGTTAFWAAEILFTVLTWVFLSSKFGIGQTKTTKEFQEETDVSTTIKTEKEDEEVDTDDADLSDTPRSFPTYGRQAPLKYVPKVKKEDGSKLVIDETTVQPLATEADDESEEPINLASFRGGRSDSGIGTSFSEAAGSSLSGLQRRRLRGDN